MFRTIHQAGLAGYHLFDLSGELLLANTGRVIGDLRLSGDRRIVSSSTVGHEQQLTASCDLDLLRLEQIDRSRGGGAPQFRLRLSPILFVRGQPVSASAHVIDFRVPHEDWLRITARFRGGEFELLEIRIGPGELEGFRRAVELLRETRKKLEEGNYDQAVASCRRVIEAMAREVPGEPSEARFFTALARATDERRAKEYAGMVARVKQLCGFAIHDFGSPLTYSRVEAQFVVRSTAALIALVAGLVGEA